MHTRLPTEEEAAQGGFLVADFIEEAEVWPENWPVFDLFAQLETQWRSDFGHRTSLDYGPLFRLLDRHCASTAEWNEMFEDIREMEKAALKAMAG